MFQMTIGEILANGPNWFKDEEPHVYIVCDGDIVFYVGRSDSIVNRILAHLSDMPTGGPDSILGQFIEANFPNSESWQVEVWTLEDCRPLVTQIFPTLQRWGIDIAEQAVIRYFCPFFNRTGNPEAQSLLSSRYVFPCSVE